MGVLGNEGANVELNSTQETTHIPSVETTISQRLPRALRTRERPGTPLHCRVNLGWQEISSSLLPNPRS